MAAVAAGRGAYVTSEALQMVRVAQGPHELARQALAALATDLAAALRLGERQAVLLVGVGGGARGVVGAVSHGQAVRRRLGFVGEAAGEAIVARVVAVGLHGRQGRGGRAHTAAGGGRRRWAGGACVRRGGAGAEGGWRRAGGREDAGGRASWGVVRVEAGGRAAMRWACWARPHWRAR